MRYDDDLGPVGGVGNGGKLYGGRHRTARKQQPKTIPDWQIRAALDGVIEESAGQPLTTRQTVQRLRIWLRDEYDAFLSEDEAMREVQSRQL